MRGEIYSWVSFTGASAIPHFVLPVTVREFFYLYPARYTGTFCIFFLNLLLIPSTVLSSRDHRKDLNLVSSDAKHPRGLLRLFPYARTGGSQEFFFFLLEEESCERIETGIIIILVDLISELVNAEKYTCRVFLVSNKHTNYCYRIIPHWILILFYSRNKFLIRISDT